MARKQRKEKCMSVRRRETFNACKSFGSKLTLRGDQSCENTKDPGDPPEATVFTSWDGQVKRILDNPFAVDH